MLMILAIITTHIATTEVFIFHPMEAMLFHQAEMPLLLPFKESHTQMVCMLSPKTVLTQDVKDKLGNEQETAQVIQVTIAQAEWLKKIEEEIRKTIKRNRKEDFYKT